MAIGAKLTDLTLPLKTKGLMLEAEPGPVPIVVVALILNFSLKRTNIFIVYAFLKKYRIQTIE
jgi:hypothetical protein